MIREGKRVLAYALCCVVLCGCSMIFDEDVDCSAKYKVRFVYDYNMKYADAFSHEVSWVTLYLVDANGNVVWQKKESGDNLAAEGYTMDVDVETGKYGLLTWCGTKEKGAFSIPESDVSRELTCTLNRKYDEESNAYIDTDIDRLFHGYVEGQEFQKTVGTHYYTVPLVKNTNTFRIVLQHISGDTVDKDKFSFKITDNNGKMDWDNSVMDDEWITYRAWRTVHGEAGIITDGAVNMNGALAAELTTARLIKGHATRLNIINNETGTNVLSIPLIDYALMVKGYYNESMDDQEYLDRQDEYNIVFFLDNSDRWLQSYVYINSWKVVLQDTGL
ncbi:MAG: FimB/Mfa2 family fimbrial subunit [Prevotella sp.]|nr:FimB/Mfa2 family fimbrial subunit [Prevotella sp.]